MEKLYQQHNDISPPTSEDHPAGELRLIFSLSVQLCGNILLRLTCCSAARKCFRWPRHSSDKSEILFKIVSDLLNKSVKISMSPMISTWEASCQQSYSYLWAASWASSTSLSCFLLLVLHELAADSCFRLITSSLFSTSVLGVTDQSQSTLIILAWKRSENIHWRQMQTILWRQLLLKNF